MLIALFALVASSVAHEDFTASNIHIPPKQDFYEFWLDVRESQTMTVGTETNEPTVLVWDTNDRVLKQRSGDECGRSVQYTLQPVPINTGDGRHRIIYTINGTMPGHTMVVYEGSDVHIHVTNNLEAKGMIIHFHGLRMVNNVWHDGGGKLNQCPIMPEETFTYKFKADVPGTYFYHGHFHDRGDGLEGAFIILPRENPEMLNSASGPVRPAAQYTGFLQDWYPNIMDKEYTYVKWGTNRYYFGFDNYQKCYAETKTFDGSRIGQLVWNSALVNGRGWHSASDLRSKPHSLPLETFFIKKNGLIAIRFINAGVLFPLAISIDDHEMEIVTSDQHDIKPITADYLTIFPGERYTALIRGLGAPTKKKYFIKIQSLEAYTEDMQALPPNHFTLAFLTYKDFTGRSSSEPLGDLLFESAKSSTTRKRMVNCPFLSFTTDFSIDCINFHKIRANQNASIEQLGDVSNPSNIQRFFFNVFNDKSLNGKRFDYPKAPPLLFKENDHKVIKPCSVCENWSGNTPCKCTHMINVTLGSTVQMVFYNREKTLQDPKGLDAFAHPIHIHGVHYHVVATGYPEYSSDGLISKFNEDIACEDTLCNKATFARELKRELNLIDPPVKDTVAVPVGGYVVMQFKATNPGWWPIHCHMLPHHLDGMAMAMKIGEYSDMPPKPEGYPTCYQNY